MKLTLLSCERRELAKHILNRLESHWFSEWYNNGAFDAFISGDTGAPSKDDILNVIEEKLIPTEIPPR